MRYPNVPAQLPPLAGVYKDKSTEHPREAPRGFLSISTGSGRKRSIQPLDVSSVDSD